MPMDNTVTTTEILNTYFNDILLILTFQKVYLMLPRSSTSVQIVTTLGTASGPRYWRIKIAMLSCDSEYLGT